ncbi:hypothetical protein AAC978_07620 [Desulfitobacterium sp. THU1]|uniref:hypothetical protein n=1 Tax=Desulfitobacterium sp. THU1 TaxID=3138072 RepID=UPI00311FC0F8
MTIHKIGNAQKYTADDYRAEKVMFVIITDGERNSSREYSAEKIEAQIAVATFRECSAMPEGWNDEIKKDYKKRGQREASPRLIGHAPS